MKYIIITLITVLAFSGCSKNNAFDSFKLTKEQELSINSLQSSKIKSVKDTDGIFSAIYLNDIYPKLFNHNEYFFVFYYMKSHNIDVKFRLNGDETIKIKKLPSNNRFTNLIDIQNNWNNYYLVSFNKQKKKTLNLLLENGLYSSDLLKYQKD